MNPLRPSPRECGLAFSGTPGVTNSIVDVADVSVGYWDHDGLNAEGRPFRTGVTAILPMGDSPLLMSCPAAIHSQNGNGEMTGSHWIKDSGRLNSPVLITNTHAVGAAHEAAVNWMTQRYKDLFENDHFWAMPVVAETYDGFTNDILALQVRTEHARLALEQAWACAQNGHINWAKAPLRRAIAGVGWACKPLASRAAVDRAPEPSNWRACKAPWVFLFNPILGAEANFAGAANPWVGCGLSLRHFPKAWPKRAH